MADRDSVFESEVSYFNPASKRWEKGIFSLNKNHFQFISDSKDDDKFHLYLPLSTICGIEKKQSSLIYPSIVISVGSEKHWFSSFPNRDATYNILELFWREALFSKQYKTVSAPRAANTILGKELLSSLQESERILVQAANALIDQEQQLENAQEAVEDINDNLKTLESNLKTSNLVPTFAKISSTLKSSENKLEEIKQIKRYKVMFSFTRVSNDNNNWEKGILIFMDNVCLVDEDGSIKMQIPIDELETFQVLSPWEMCISSSNDDLKSCYIMCPQLSRLLKCLSSGSAFKEKIIYSNDNCLIDDAEPCSSSSFDIGFRRKITVKS